MRSRSSNITSRLVAENGLYEPQMPGFNPGPKPSTSFTIYVNKGGSNGAGADGTDEAPFLTFGKACTVAKTLVGRGPGQQVRIVGGPGIYAETVPIPAFVTIDAEGSLLGADIEISEVTLDIADWIANEANFISSAVCGCLIDTISLDWSTMGIAANGQVSLIESEYNTLTALGGAENVPPDSPRAAAFSVSCWATGMGTTTLTGANLIDHACEFVGDISIVTTASLAATWTSTNSAPEAPITVTLDSRPGQFLTYALDGTSLQDTLVLRGINTSGTGSWQSIPNVDILLNTGPEPVINPQHTAAFGPRNPPTTTPANPYLYATGSATGTGNDLSATSDQGMQTTLAPAGVSPREFIDRQVVEVLGVAGSGGSGAASCALKAEFCHEVLVSVIGVADVGNAGFRQTATATVRVDSTGVAAFVTAAGGNTNPTVDPLNDKAMDALFAVTTIALTVAGGDLVCTITNASPDPHDFCVFFEVKGFGVTAPFTPASLEGLIAWYRADLGVAQVANSVSSWADQSGFGHTLTPNASPAQNPTLVPADPNFNGKPSIQFIAANVTNLRNTTAGGVFTQPYTVAIPFKFNSAAASSGLVGDDGGNVDVYKSGGAWAFQQGVAITGGVADQVPHIAIATVTGGSAGDLFIDGVLVAAGAIGALAAAGLSLGGLGLIFADANVPELAIYNRVLAADERAALTTYFQARYGAI